jgi:hypothetical protein
MQSNNILLSNPPSYTTLDALRDPNDDLDRSQTIQQQIYSGYADHRSLRVEDADAVEPDNAVTMTARPVRLPQVDISVLDRNNVENTPIGNVDHHRPMPSLPDLYQFPVPPEREVIDSPLSQREIISTPSAYRRYALGSPLVNDTGSGTSPSRGVPNELYHAHGSEVMKHDTSSNGRVGDFTKRFRFLLTLPGPG